MGFHSAVLPAQAGRREDACGASVACTWCPSFTAPQKNDGNCVLTHLALFEVGYLFHPRHTALIPWSCAGFFPPLPDFTVICGALRGHGARTMEYVYGFQHCLSARLYLESHNLICHHLPYGISYLCRSPGFAYYSFAPTYALCVRVCPARRFFHVFLKQSPCRLLKAASVCPGSGERVPLCRGRHTGAGPRDQPPARGGRRSAGCFPGQLQPGCGHPIPWGAFFMVHRNSGAVSGCSAVFTNTVKKITVVIKRVIIIMPTEHF